MYAPCISIIIPTLNEAYYLAKLIPHLWNSDTQQLIHEILVADAGSTDNTCLIAQQAGARVVHCPQKGRAKQMNYAANRAAGTILHFIHADSFPPKGFTSAVVQAMQRKQVQAGCFRSLFDSTSRFLRINSYFTRFSGNFFRGGGQTLFVDNQLFKSLSGYRNDMVLMEEYDLIRRIKKEASFTVIQQDVLVSDRDYQKHGNVSLQARYFLLVLIFFSGLPHVYLKKAHRLLCPNKLVNLEQANIRKQEGQLI